MVWFGSKTNVIVSILSFHYPTHGEESALFLAVAEDPRDAAVLQWEDAATDVGVVRTALHQLALGVDQDVGEEEEHALTGWRAILGNLGSVYRTRVKIFFAKNI